MYKRAAEALRKNISVYLGITVGAVLMGAALSVFLVPFKIAPGGISGLATVLHHLTKIRVSTLILLINAPIFVLGLLNFDAHFLIKSVYGTIILSVAAEGFSYISPLTDDVLLACVFGGAIMGCGIATVLRSGGTTGGSDILVLVTQKYFPNFSVGQLFMVIDGTIIAVAGAIFGNWNIILYSAVALFISSRVTDTILEGVKFARLVYIISGRNFEITHQIYSEMDRGVTGLSSVSMYTGKKGRILLCAIRKYELPKLKRLIYSVDPNAFVIISDAKEVMGNFRIKK